MITRKQLSTILTYARDDDASWLSRGKITGNWIIRDGFFYRHGGDASGLAAKVSAQLTAAGIKHTIVDQGEKWAAFRRGTTLKQSSHWWVEIKIS